MTKKFSPRVGPAFPILTIAVPTYNRAQRLQQCLIGLEEQLAELADRNLSVEVLVVDNASTDETFDVCNIFKEKIPSLKYIRNEKNLGIDGNIYRCSQLSNGTWVQLLSDDDILLPGAISYIISQILYYPEADFLFLNPISFADDLPPRDTWEPRVPVRENTICMDPNDLVSSCGIWLTFLSSFVFRRNSWNASGRGSTYIGTDIYLSFALFDMLAIGNPSVILARPLVAARAHYSGSYRIFYAFGRQWPELLLSHAPKLGFNYKKMRSVLDKTIITDLLPRILAYRLNDAELQPEDRRNIFYGAKVGHYSTVLIWLSATIPHFYLNKIRAVFKFLKKIAT
jgi:glycosyltransferase involved in cell wall biosynthesis